MHPKADRTAQATVLTPDLHPRCNIIRRQQELRKRRIKTLAWQSEHDHIIRQLRERQAFGRLVKIILGYQYHESLY